MQECKIEQPMITTKEELDNLYKSIQAGLSSPKNEDVLSEDQGA